MEEMPSIREVVKLYFTTFHEDDSKDKSEKLEKQLVQFVGLTQMDSLTKYSDGVLLRGLFDFSLLTKPELSPPEERRIFGYFDGLTGIILGKQREPIWGFDVHYNEGYVQGIKEKDERQ